MLRENSHLTESVGQGAIDRLLEGVAFRPMAASLWVLMIALSVLGIFCMLREKAK
jgi:hypothetical protein